MQMVSSLKPAYLEVRARSDVGSVRSAQPVLKAPKTKGYEGVMLSGIERGPPLSALGSASSDGAGDDMFLSVQRPDGQGIEDKIAAAARAATEATKKVLDKDFWGDMAIGLCKVVGGGYDVFIESRPKASCAVASTDMDDMN